uniref:NADH-ubiquinone oxidoreductase chain 5 n=1 Tax=Bathynella cf. rufa JHS-2017 TaxID=2029186 RepID=A0A7R6D8D0_9CRUS|nr:NADH dehydrogenase subunit 5 [Bathynella cf. rufa JHS-2017]
MILIMLMSLMMLMMIMLLLFNMTMILDFSIFVNSFIPFSFSFYLDFMSTLFSMVVMLISLLVFIYSEEYMNKDIYKSRFMWLTFFFINSMLLLIFSGNIFFLILGWDGLGLTSFLLIIYYQNNKSLNSGMLTIFTNRIGDLFIILSIIMYLFSWNSFNMEMKMEFFIMIMMLLAALTKSAQFPFTAWLPAAMAAPTPISALVHSSTLVTAGVYILIRYKFIIENNMMITLLLYLSIITMIFSGWMALYETDLKKIIAMSTLSQLGLMMFMISKNMMLFSFMHMIFHALFKSLLFLMAGIIIHQYNGNQDIRNMKNNSIIMPMTMMNINVALLAMMGIPFLSGAFSKHMFIIFFFKEEISILMKISMFIAMTLTILYSLRLLMMLNSYSMKMNSFINLKENLSFMLVSTMLLCYLVIVMGNVIMLNIPFYQIQLNFMEMDILMLMLLVLSIMMILMKLNIKKLSKMILIFQSSMWFISIWSTKIITKKFMELSFIFILSEMTWMHKSSSNQVNFILYKTKNILMKSLMSSSYNIIIFTVLIMLMMNM